MNASLLAVVYAVIFMTASCGENKKNLRPGEKAEGGGKVLKETIATGNLGFDELADFRKNDIRADLCQRWEFGKNEGASSSEFILDKYFNPISPQYSFFKDGSVLENPRQTARTGKWEIRGRDSLHMFFDDSTHKWFIITAVDSRDLRMVTKNELGKALYLNLKGSALVHKNMYNDPFHPVNNQWRIKPAKPESDSAIRQRVVNCLKFYALFYRDNLLRNKSSINFEGLPTVFKWYRGGIGIPDEDKIDEKWIECFFDWADAIKGYKFMRTLIVKYEYEWPEKVEWWLQTHSVLEQMYHKAVKML